jgi:hypothetical protein
LPKALSEFYLSEKLKGRNGVLQDKNFDFLELIPGLKSSFLLTRYTVENVPSPMGLTTRSDGKGAGNSGNKF